jgi:hypothetical protein
LSSTKRTTSSSHGNVTSSLHDITEKLLTSSITGKAETFIDASTFLYYLKYENEFIIRHLFWIGLKLAVTRVDFKIAIFFSIVVNETRGYKTKGNVPSFHIIFSPFLTGFRHLYVVHDVYNIDSTFNEHYLYYFKIVYKSGTSNVSSLYTLINNY